MQGRGAVAQLVVLTDRSMLASGLFGSIVLLSMFQVQSADWKRNENLTSEQAD